MLWLDCSFLIRMAGVAAAAAPEVLALAQLPATLLGAAAEKLQPLIPVAYDYLGDFRVKS